ncbi:hypothetical protein LTR08_007885 [Meristemomyces frigidus]|nr:hypothetical protein LTR08_007885 [Meristemomyces frigidus]
MDDYALHQALEALADNASDSHPPATASNPEPISTTTARWQTLFHLAPDAALDHLIAHRTNLARTSVSDDHWETVRPAKEAAGYDREAYAYELEAQKKRALLLLQQSDADSVVPAAGSRAVTYLLELSGPLDSAEAVRAAAGLEAVPMEVCGQSVEEDRVVRLCLIDGVAKAAVLRWASREGGWFEPTVLVDPRSLR